MNNPPDTRNLLEKMSDTGQFERLATDVLRAAETRYRGLAHTGVNADGKPIKSPVDGISVNYDSSGRILILTAHTTAAKNKLRGKWLTASDSDYKKAAHIIADERERESFDKAIIVLTSNREPAENLIRDVHATAEADVEFDLWSGSRISNFLDNDPEGQWIRSQFFGKAIQRVSISLLHQLAERSVEQYQPQFERAVEIDREADSELSHFVESCIGAVFVLGESGQGKSVASWRYARKWIGTGKSAIFISHETVEQNSTLARALSSELRLLEPSLEEDCGAAALAICHGDETLLLIVEDANEAANPEKLINRLLKWEKPDSGGDKSKPNWRLLCPMWPSTAALADPRVRDTIEGSAIRIGAYGRNESIKALQAKAEISEHSLTEVQMDAVARALGDDPLLIALSQEPFSDTASQVIASFISHNLANLEDSETLVADLNDALRQLAEKMILQKNTAPSWEELAGWFQNEPDTSRSLRKIIHQGKIIRLADKGNHYTLAYRHDRVRDFLLSEALTRLIKSNDLPDEIWEDPYFCELIGTALIRCGTDYIDKAAQTNPVAFFAALSRTDVDSDFQTLLLKKARAWVCSPQFRRDDHLNQRYHAIEILAQTDGDFVCDLIDSFADSHWGTLEAQLRNGDVEAGVRLCRSFEPSLHHRWRDQLIEHARTKFPTIIGELAEYIRNPDITAEGLYGALNFAGELGDPTLASAIRESWERDANAERIGAAWIWAALMCFDGEDRRLLDSLCGVWASLPEKEEREDNGDAAPRWDLVGHALPFALARKPYEPAIDYLVEKAGDIPELDWPITTIIDKVDLPQAVTAIVHRMAQIDHKVEGTDGFNVFANTGFRQWDTEDDHGRRMSASSRSALEKLWDDTQQDKWVRIRAFGLWNQTLSTTEVTEISRLEDDEVLADAALRARLKNRDQSATPLLRKRLTSDKNSADHWWHHARRLGLDGLTDLVEATLNDRRAGRLKTYKDGGTETDHILSELLMDRRDAFSESVILEHWDHLKNSPNYVHSALYIATPSLVEKASKVIDASSQPANLFRFLHMHWGHKTFNRPGIVDLKQMEAVAPYIKHLDWLCVGALFEACNRLGFYDWRKQHVDPQYFSFAKTEAVGNEAAIFSSLDRLIEREKDRDGPDTALHFWLKDRQSEGWTPADLLEVVCDWAVSRQSEESLVALASAIRQIGNRSDLSLLSHEGLSQGQAESAAIANCRYAVRRRSLH